MVQYRLFLNDEETFSRSPQSNHGAKILQILHICKFLSNFFNFSCIFIISQPK